MSTLQFLDDAGLFFPNFLLMWLQIFMSTIFACVILFLARVVYNLFLHPLRNVPGPLLHRATVLGRCHALVTGILPFKVHELHEKYGPVVRLSPNEVSFSKPEAWRDIYTRNKVTKKWELPRDWTHYNKPADPNLGSILESDREPHDVMRKSISPAFSDRALRSQELTIKKYIELLVLRLKEHGVDGATGKSKPVNLTDWVAFSTFDVTGFLTFGSDFGCLQGGDYHPWVALIMGAVKDLAMMGAIRSFSQNVFQVIMWAAMKTGLGASAHKLHNELTAAKTHARMHLGTGRDDFLNNWIKDGMPFEQLRENAGLLIIAGSETTATALTGLLYFVLSQPEIHQKLKDEIRGSFFCDSDITSSTVNNLAYMHAVINEALRMYPPVPIAAMRVVPETGANIDGMILPPNTHVGIWQYAIYRDSRLFANPHKFDPERWLQKEGDVYANDHLDAVKPFIVGPRNCIGMSLAYYEMKLILARLVLEFDMELHSDSKSWFEGQKVWLLWDKPPLNVVLTERKGR